MNNILGQQTCGNCGARAARDAAFCPNCGRPLPGGRIRCGNCGTDNVATARFCRQCGRPLAIAAAPEMRGARWARGRDDIAVRVEVDDVKRFFNSPLIVEPGTNAIFLEGGRSVGVLPPGEYTVDTLGDRVKAFFGLQAPNRVTVILTDVAPLNLEFNMGGMPTSSGLRVGLTCQLTVSLENPVTFFTGLMRGQERYRRVDLTAYLSPEANNAASEWVRAHTAEQLGTDLRLKQELELALEQHLENTLQQIGLKFERLRTVNWNTEQLDRITGLRIRYELQVSEEEARQKGEHSLAELVHQGKLAEVEGQARALEIEHKKVEIEEKKAEIYKRMRDSVLANRIDEVRSEADFERFLDEQDHEKLLRERDKAELLRVWKEGGEDRDRARAHLLAKLELEQQFELRSAEIRLRSDVAEQEQQAQIRLERLRADRQLEVETERWEFDLKRRRAELQITDEEEAARRQRVELDGKAQQALAGSAHDEEMRQMNDELELGFKGLRGMKQIRQEAERNKWELERERLETGWQQQQRQAEIDIQRERIHMEHELNRLDKLGQLGTEALIAASPAEQGRIIADLKKTETLKGMTEEQILAAAAKESPEVARALQEKFRSIAQGQANQQTAELYERMLATSDAAGRQAREDADKRVHDVSDAWDRSSARGQDLAGHALDRMAETAQAFARGSGSPPVIVVSTSGQTVTYPGSATAAGGPANAESKETKVCPNCGRHVDVSARHCQHCGNEFAGM